MLVNEQKSATFTSIVKIRGKKHHKNAHNNKCHIYYSLNYDKKIFGVSRSPTENIDGVGGEKIFFPESELESESKKSTTQGTTPHTVHCRKISLEGIDAFLLSASLETNSSIIIIMLFVDF
jgi:hypothetical protein